MGMGCLPSQQRPKSILWGKKGVDSGSGLAWRTFWLELCLLPAHTGGHHPTLGTPFPKEECGAGWPWVRCQLGLSSTQ